MFVLFLCIVFFFKQKTAYEMRISDWSSDVCSSDLRRPLHLGRLARARFLSRAPREMRTRKRQLFRGAVRPGQVARAEKKNGRALQQPDEIGRASCRERVCQYV